MVLAAVRQHGEALEFASEECKKDSEIVLAAVRQFPRALRWASEECKRDRLIVFAAVIRNGWALEFAAEECKRDREIVLAAVRNYVDYARDEEIYSLDSKINDPMQERVLDSGEREAFEFREGPPEKRTLSAVRSGGVQEGFRDSPRS
eukprot:3608865-Amphidinium_carterae.1